MGVGEIGEYAENLIGIEAQKLVGRAGITRSEIEDLRQDLRLHLWRRLPMFDPSRAKYETFVDRIVRHRAATIVEFRKAARRSHLRCQCSLNEGINYSDEVVDRARAEAEEADGAAVDMAEALADAEKDLAEERERARRAAIRVKARFTSQVVDPFEVFHIEPWRERGWDKDRQPSEKMLALLERNGIDTAGLTFTQAKQLVGEVIQRYEERKCSFKQARLLGRYGYPTDVLFAEASRRIDALAKNGWKRPEAAESVEVY